jgi:glycosyltransferase involved in cell wall biosynthesis
MTAEQINEFLKHKNYYNGELINNPCPIEGQMEPYLLYLMDNNFDIEYSIVMPIHNQESIIYDNLHFIIKNTSGNFEMIIILDNCVDNTETIVLDIFNNLKDNEVICGKLHRVIIIKQPSPIFETSCDNIGFRLSKGKYVIEIQSDMKMVGANYNLDLSKPFELYNDVFAVSGRCTHEIISNGVSIGYGKWIAPTWDYLSSNDVSFDEIVKLTTTHKGLFYTMDTCNRGPLIILRERLMELGYLDEMNFVLGNDEHDLMMRARYFKNWICGHVVIEAFSPTNDGTTRKERTAENEEYFQKRINRRSASALLYNQWLSMNHRTKPLEIRDMNKI